MESKPEPSSGKLINFDPDIRPSSSALWAEDRGADVIWVIQVKHFGALVLRATPTDDGEKIEFNGVSGFTDAEIGWHK